MMLKLTLIVILGIFWCNCIQPDPGTKGPWYYVDEGR